jgi:hypothetical protein
MNAFTQQMMDALHVGFIVCIVLSALCLVLTVILFIRFDIWGIMRGGRKRTHAIAEGDTGSAIPGARLPGSGPLAGKAKGSSRGSGKLDGSGGLSNPPIAAPPARKATFAAPAGGPVLTPQAGSKQPAKAAPAVAGDGDTETMSLAAAAGDAMTDPLYADDLTLGEGWDEQTSVLGEGDELTGVLGVGGGPEVTTVLSAAKTTDEPLYWGPEGPIIPEAPVEDEALTEDDFRITGETLITHT